MTSPRTSGVNASTAKVCGPTIAGRLRPKRAVGCKLPTEESSERRVGYGLLLGMVMGGGDQQKKVLVYLLNGLQFGIQ